MKVLSKLKELTVTEYGCPTSALITKRKYSIKKEALTWWPGTESEGWYVKKEIS